MKSSTLRLSLAALLVWLPCTMLHAWAHDAAMVTPADAAMPFNIPVKPLSQALQDYAAVTGRPTLYRSDLAAQRMSAPVRGTLNPGQALQVMLAGTGLVAAEFQDGDDRGFTLALAPQAPSYEDAGDYIAWLQQRVWNALCANKLSAPGSYRVLLRFRIGATGRFHQQRLLTSSGQQETDRAILSALQGTQLNILPPAAMPQPVTMLIVPNDAQASRRCADARSVAP
ncbi:TonB family protein [Herbaspirillum robiniae]|uniref:TonB family protein n=1 Tax=Herbaspirillum robiniae TaxID=2014887 RepID=UPI003D78670E